MSKKQRHARQKITHILVSFCVLFVFIAPIYLSVRWVIGIFGERDPRKVTTVAAMQPRPVDQTAEVLKPFSQPLVSVSFDDGWQSVYTDALPILQRYGIHTTHYVMSDTFSNYSYMSVAQLLSLQQAGHDIASHTVSHADLTTLDEAELTHELQESQQVLAEHFGLSKDFTSPYGAYNAHTLQAISKYYRSQKNAEGDPSANELETINVKSTFTSLNIKSYSVRNTTTLSDIEKLLKAAQHNNGWLVLTYHQVDYSNETFSVTPEAFDEQMKFVSSKPIRSATIGRVLDAYVEANPGEGQ